MSEREKFEKWKREHSMNLEIDIKDSNGDYQYIETRRDWYVWQAALSTRKPFCLGVIKANGDAYKTFHTSEEEQANKFVKFLNNEDIVGTPCRVVELFYEEQS